MAATLVQTKSGTGTTATVTVTWDTPAVAGDLLVITAGSDDYLVAGGLPAGFTQPPNGAQETFLGNYAWYKVATGGETSATYTIGSPAGSVWSFDEWSGTAATSPLDASNGTWQQSFLAAASAWQGASVTPTAGDRLIVAVFGGLAGAGGTMTGAVSAVSGGFVKDVESVTTLGNGARDFAALTHLAATASGASAYAPQATFANTPNGTQARTSIIISFKVAAGGPATVTGSAALSGQSGLTTAGSVDIAGLAALTANSNLTAAATTSTPAAPQVFGSAALAASGTLTATARSAVRGTASWSAQTNLTAIGRVDVRATAALTASGLLGAGARLQTTGAASLSATGTLEARALSGVAVQVKPPLSVSLAATNTSAELGDTRTKVTM